MYALNQQIISSSKYYNFYFFSLYFLKFGLIRGELIGNYNFNINWLESVEWFDYWRDVDIVANIHIFDACLLVSALIISPLGLRRNIAAIIWYLKADSLD